MKPNYPSSRQAHYSLAVLLLAYILSFVDRQILSLLVGPIRQDLAISDFQTSLLQGMAFALFYCFLGIPIGRLADSKRRTTIIAVGVLLWSVMTMMCGLARSFGTLFLARMGVGVGEATLSPAAYSILSDSFPPPRLARATGIFSMGITIGSGLAYIVGGRVIELISGSGAVSLPVVGLVRPWQSAFIVVGLPGLAIALLILTIGEPLRQGLLGQKDHSPDVTLQFAEVLRFLAQRWRTYIPIYLSISLLSVLGYGTLNWYPTFLIRTYGMTAGRVGLHLGLIYLVCGTAGALGGALLSEYFGRHYRDAHMRVVMVVAIALLMPATIGPLMPTAGLAMALAAPTMFLLNAFFGVSVAALQVITPNQMRGVVSSTFLFMTTLIGLAGGATSIALITEFVFCDDMSLRYSLAVVAMIVCPLASAVVRYGLMPYRQALDDATRCDWSAAEVAPPMVAPPKCGPEERLRRSTM